MAYYSRYFSRRQKDPSDHYSPTDQETALPFGCYARTLPTISAIDEWKYWWWIENWGRFDSWSDWPECSLYCQCKEWSCNWEWVSSHSELLQCQQCYSPFLLICVSYWRLWWYWLPDLRLASYSFQSTPTTVPWRVAGRVWQLHWTFWWIWTSPCLTSPCHPPTGSRCSAVSQARPLLIAGPSRYVFHPRFDLSLWI